MSELSEYNMEYSEASYRHGRTVYNTVNEEFGGTAHD